MDIWDNQKRLASRVNFMKARIIIGRQNGRQVNLRAASFSGVKTIGLFWVRERVSCRFDAEMEISSGRAKLILVRQDKVTTLIQESGEEAKILILDKGFNRLRIVGEQASLKLSLVMTKGVSILE